MGKADYSRLDGMSFLFNPCDADSDISYSSTSKKGTLVKKPSNFTEDGQVKTRQYWFDEFMKLYREKDFDQITYRHWIYYFIGKAKLNGVTYQRGQQSSPQNMKEAGIIKALMKEYTVDEIKSMMDFVWDVWKPTGFIKNTMGIWIFSAGWMNTVVQLTDMWKKGEYPPKKNDPKSLREWRDPSPERGSEPTTKRKPRTYIE